MHQHFLREVAKVGVGLVIADLLTGAWFAAAGLLPVSVLGISWTASMLPAAFVFDLGLLILLAHYAWRMRLPIASPSERTLLYVTGAVFLLVALAHLARLAFGAAFILGPFMLPVWLSWVGVGIAAYLSYASFHFAGIRRR